MVERLLARFRRKPVTTPTLLERIERCSACPLGECVRGERATVLTMHCAIEEARKLRNLGLYEGSSVTVIDRQDGCLLDVRGSRLALAAQLADSITVLPIR